MGIYGELSGYYGPQEWWPSIRGAEWEIMLGCVLTQHTTWANVELALNNIYSVWGPEGLSRPEKALQAPIDELAGLLRPVGFYAAKPRKVERAPLRIEAGTPLENHPGGDGNPQ